MHMRWIMSRKYACQPNHSEGMDGSGPADERIVRGACLHGYESSTRGISQRRNWYKGTEFCRGTLFSDV